MKYNNKEPNVTGSQAYRKEKKKEGGNTMYSILM
jgi:hypothetical protein